MAIDVTDDARKKALLLHYAGEKVQDAFETFQNHDKSTFTETKKALAEHFQPKRNLSYEVFNFRKATQHEDETVDQFAARLRELSAHCEFHDVERELKSQIELGTSTKKVRRYAFRSPDLKLEALLLFARTLEHTELQAKDIEHAASPRHAAEVQKVTLRDKPVSTQSQKRKPVGKGKSAEKKCYNCGYSYPHVTKPCPAKGKQCNKCQKTGHFAQVCRSKAPRVIKEVASLETRPDGSDSDGSLYAIDSVHAVGKLPAFKINVAFDAIKIPFYIDTGSSVNILDGTTYQKLCSQLGNIQLSKGKIKLKAYGNTTLKVIGKLSYAVEIRHLLLPFEFYVVAGNNGCLLSGDTALEARLLSVPKSAAQQVSLTKAIVKKVKDTREETAQETADTSVAQKTALFPNVPPRLGKLLNDYEHIFHGIGMLKDYQLKLHIDKSVAPVSQPARRAPFPLRHRLAQEIQLLEDMGIIEDAKGPTPWVSPLVVFPKPKDPENLRICVDMRCPNVAIKRENHVTPTVDDFVHGLNGATVFSKLDLTSAYHQIELDEQSRYITKFATHVGLKRYTRLNYGTNSAAEILIILFVS